MEQIPEKKELSVSLPVTYIKQIYNILLVANNRATWHPDELIPVGATIKELKNILERSNVEKSNNDEPIEEEEKPKEE